MHGRSPTLSQAFVQQQKPCASQKVGLGHTGYWSYVLGGALAMVCQLQSRQSLSLGFPSRAQWRESPLLAYHLPGLTFFVPLPAFVVVVVVAADQREAIRPAWQRGG